MIEKHVAHDAPTQARPPTQCGVDVGSADDPLSNEVINLPRQRRLQEERADLLAKEILEIADAPCKDAVEVAHARNRLDTRQWLASQLSPRKYGDRVEHDHKGGLKFQPAVLVQIGSVREPAETIEHDSHDVSR